MTVFKASAAFNPTETGLKSCDNYYFNSKTATCPEECVSKKVAYRDYKSGKQVYAVFSEENPDGADRELLFDCGLTLKKYHSFFVKNEDVDVQKLLKNYCIEVSTKISVMSSSNNGSHRLSVAIVCIDGDNVWISNVGDVKIFHIGKDFIREVSQEHTQAKKMIEMGLISPEKAENHPQRKKLLKYLGGSRELAIPYQTNFTIKPGETISITGASFYDYAGENNLSKFSSAFDQPTEISEALCTKSGLPDDLDQTCVVIRAYDDAPIAELEEKQEMTFVSEPEATAAVAAEAVKSSKKKKKKKKKNSESDKQDNAKESSEAGTESIADSSKLNAEELAVVKASADENFETENTEEKPDLGETDENVEDFGITDNLKAFLGIGDNVTQAEKDNVKLWPSVVIFIITLLLFIVLMFFISEMKKADNPKESEAPVATATATDSQDEDSEKTTASPEASPEPTAEEATAQPTEAPDVATKRPDDMATPSPKPTARPTVEPTATPTATVAPTATAKATAQPTMAPTTEPTTEPTAEPTVEVTTEPTAEPTAEPTEETTAEPTEEVTAEPTEAPSEDTSEPE